MPLQQVVAPSASRYHTGANSLWQNMVFSYIGCQYQLSHFFGNRTIRTNQASVSMTVQLTKYIWFTSKYRHVFSVCMCVDLSLRSEHISYVRIWACQYVIFSYSRVIFSSKQSSEFYHIEKKKFILHSNVCIMFVPVLLVYLF